MSDDTDSQNASSSTKTTRDGSPTPKTTAQQVRSIFSIPPGLRRVFDKYPLVSYEGNDAPIRAPRTAHHHVLHIFTSEESAKSSKPSFNPSCLRYQTYLKFTRLEFLTTPSSNHASPSGSLPFLLPALSEKHGPLKLQEPVSANKLRKWLKNCKEAKPVEEPEDVRYEAYASLVEDRIRKAWLYQLYLEPSNRSVVNRLYVSPCSSNTFVQLTIHHQLRNAAIAQLSTTSSTIVESELLRNADEAFSALSVLLGEDEYFFGQQGPGLFDASLFAYTHLILSDDAISWKTNRLGEVLKKYSNVMRHQQRITELYY
ncbi:hypothetical protein K431DRAFT_238014 [Polychaeton citri CBS 116435]|uniref:Mitochondrial outer membrane protein n=1 Tax=Polychaeton citri CBS 116435 TaxID=1314669 RepID=A0A9P4QGI0_9PEZI|nr:hypothetical protein K431DRAFT_238014 [Polychaeton citri CBS 116435]